MLINQLLKVEIKYDTRKKLKQFLYIYIYIYITNAKHFCLFFKSQKNTVALI